MYIKFFRIILLLLFLFRLSYADSRKDFDINNKDNLSLISKFYPMVKFNNNNITCNIASIPNSYSNYNNFFCMGIKGGGIVKTIFGKRILYILTVGDLIDLTTGEESGIHADTGAVGMFIFEENNSKWKLVAYRDNFIFGSWGRAPDKWDFKEFGPNKWGFIDIDKYMQHGIETQNYIILLVDGKNIISSEIFKLDNNTGFYGENCTDRTWIDIKECKKKLTNLQAELKINKKLGEFNGYYPLEFILNGFEGYKKYNNKIYNIYYSNHKYDSPHKHNN